MPPPEQSRPICIIGAGLAGLSAALRLAQRRVPVLVLEKDDRPGGLAAAVSLGDTRIERYYHFICRPDADLIRLIGEVGLAARLHWRNCRTSYFHKETLYPFGTPFDLLRFAPIPFSQRIRFGLNIVHSRYRQHWRDLDRESARDWLTRHIGAEAYAEIWEPLLRMKFGGCHDEISAAWIWHRVNRVASSRRRVWERDSFGYLEGGSQTLVDRLVEEIRRHGGDVRLNTEVRSILSRDGAVTAVQTAGDAAPLPCCAVYSTVPLPILVSLLPPDVPGGSAENLERIRAVSYIGVVCLLLRIRRPLTDSYWVNVKAPDVPFNGFIEYTRLNTHFDGGRTHVLYIPFYVPTSDRWYWAADEEVLDACVAALRRVRGDFSAEWVSDWRVSRAPYAQAVCTVGFGDRVPPIEGPLRGLLLSDSCQLYPEDRTLSGMVRLGGRVAETLAAGGCSRTRT